MPNHSDYRCTECEKPYDKELLMAVKVSFVEVGLGGQTKKSRIISWLCPSCLVKNEIWNKPKYSTPGHIPSDDLVRLRERQSNAGLGR